MCHFHRSAWCAAVAGLALALGSLPCLAQAVPPGAPAAPAATPAPIAIESASGPMSCPYCDLRGKDLAGKNLTNANLVGSDLRGANLAGATLDGAILIGANLEGADLSGAHLSSASNGPADLTDANLAGARFPRAVLTGAQLPLAGLEGADFSGADLTGAVLGPSPKLGAKDGRQTSFRGARMDRRAGLGAPADLSGVIWNEPKAPETAPGPIGVTCPNILSSEVFDPLYISTQGTDSAACGDSLTTACKTFAHALTRCAAPPHAKACSLLAMFGEYVLPATLALDSHTLPPNGVVLIGGCVAGQPDPGLTSLIVAPPGGLPAVSVAMEKRAQVNFSNFKILGSRAAAGHGAPAVTVLVAQNTFEFGFKFSFGTIVGGLGGKGADGAAAHIAGAKGGDASNQTAGVNQSCGDANGGAGANKMIAHWTEGTYPQLQWSCDGGCYGASGSPGGTSNRASGGPNGDSFEAAWCPPSTPYDGHSGVSGKNADCGTGGAASTSLVGAFNGTTWSPGAGGSGISGGNAGGGGGGGAGGGYGGICFIEFDYEGSSGGGGGAGGCGGPPGQGGQQGGSSLAIVAVAGSHVQLGWSRVVAGRGGDGGVGGGGGNGGGFGAHAIGAGRSGYGYHGGKGGDGGDGGTGSGGGGGAGGNGGPSAAVALVGGAKIKVDGDVVFDKGASGDFGGGSVGGTSPACPAGNGGTSGVLGTAAETITYP